MSMFSNFHVGVHMHMPVCCVHACVHADEGLYWKVFQSSFLLSLAYQLSKHCWSQFYMFASSTV